MTFARIATRSVKPRSNEAGGAAAGTGMQEPR